jgi:hypothetical protein
MSGWSLVGLAGSSQFVGGVSVDFDRAPADDFAQWSVQIGDSPEPDRNATKAAA